MEKRQLVAIKKKNRKEQRLLNVNSKKSYNVNFLATKNSMRPFHFDVEKKISCKFAGGFVKRRCGCQRFNLACAAFDHPQMNPTETPVIPLLNDRSDRNDNVTCVCFFLRDSIRIDINGEKKRIIM